MSANTVNAGMVCKMFLAGAKNLESKKAWINELNVFPVPDGDTGTNMTLTIMAAAKEVSRLDSMGDITMTSLCGAIANGSLRGARGNSGVILSQLFSGFAKIAKTADELDAPILADAFDKAVETAYKAVIKPKEGTILTVAKAGAAKMRELADAGKTDLEEIFPEILKATEEMLQKTPELLPILKEAGVVDSGGQGLLEVLKGCYDAFQGKVVDYSLPSETKPVTDHDQSVRPDASVNADIKFGYCTEFIILLSKNFNVKTEMDFKAYLESIGDSIVLVASDDVVKVHVHTNDPGLAIQRALKYGQLANMKIDNMRLEHQEKIAREEASKRGEGSAPAAQMPHKEIGFIAVSMGEGMAEIFRSLGVDHIIEGGQTMNPSTEDMLNAIDQVNADTIYILPNNKNVILAANQAVDLSKDKKIVVIPTKTVPQGIAAVINYVPDLPVEDNTATMNEAIGLISTGQVTHAVRDTVIEDKTIHEGDFMGIGDAGIISVGADMKEVVYAMIAGMVSEETELISVYYGKDVTEEEAEEVVNALSEEYPDCDVELQNGGQPVYYYIVSAE